MPIFEAREVRDDVIRKINATCIDHFPFQHTVIDNFFPKDFFRQLNRYFPDYDDIGFHDLMKRDFRYIKSVFNTETRNTKKEAKDIYDTFSQLFTLDLAEVILKKFNITVNSELGWMCDYCWDLPNDNRQALTPHTDHPSKIVSIVVYLPILETPLRVIDGQVQYLPMPGTDILVQNSDLSFTEIKKIQAQGNRATMFCKSDISWHSVDPTLYPRKTITMFIVDPAGCEGKRGFCFRKL
jgi:hypothetical protein